VTGLRRQQSGSQDHLSFADAETYTRDLNNQRFASYNDWRLPTLEEAMSLKEAQARDGLYIDPVFDGTHSWIWTTDKPSAWVVDFCNGYCVRNRVTYRHFVRVIR